MTDRATIRFPYRTREGRLRWGRWTGSRAAAFNAGAEALGGLTAFRLRPLGFLWTYAEPLTKAHWMVNTDDVVMLGAALIARLPEPSERTWRDKDLADIVEDGGPLAELATADAPDKHRPSFDDLFDAWASNTPARRQLTDNSEDPT